MLDQMAASSDHLQWLKQYGSRGKSPMSTDQFETFLAARRYMFHAPVLRRDELTRTVFVVPLNSLDDSINMSRRVLENA